MNDNKASEFIRTFCSNNAFRELAIKNIQEMSDEDKVLINEYISRKNQLEVNGCDVDVDTTVHAYLRSRW